LRIVQNLSQVLNWRAVALKTQFSTKIRTSPRIDANKLARVGRIDPQSLFPIEHRSTQVRQDLVVLRARDALVTARTQLINTTRGLVKSMGARVPKCSMN